MNQHNVQNAPHYTSYHLQGEEEFKVRSLDNGCFPFAVKEWDELRNPVLNLIEEAFEELAK